MSIKDLSKAWDEATLHAMGTHEKDELTLAQLSKAAGLQVRTGVAAGEGWDITAHCTEWERC